MLYSLPRCLWWVALAALATLTAGASETQEETLPETLQAVATQVYALMDADLYADFYHQFAGAQFRQQLELDTWEQEAGRARIALGIPLERTLKEIRSEKTIYGEPVVELYTLLFEAKYSEAQVYDRLIIQQEAGEWKVVGIWSVARD